MTSCPDPIDLSRALVEGPDTSLRRHLATCDACRSEWSAHTRIGELGRALPVDVPTGARREALRAAILSEAAQARPMRSRARWPLAVGLAIAALALVTFGLSLVRPEPPPATPIAAAEPAAPAPIATTTHRGHVRARPGTRFTLATPLPDETVRVDDGAVRVDVEHLEPGERFRVLTGDAEVEVRGTAFEVVVATNRLRSVHVTQGRVEVRPEGRRAIVLGAGEAWKAESIQALGTQLPIPEAAPEPAVEPLPETRAPPSRSPGAEAATKFDEALGALRAGRHDDAVRALEDALATDPDGGLAEEARFWRAVALRRAGRSEAALAALADLEARHPASLRLGEARAMAGALHLDRSEIDAAERAFTAAAADPSPAVAAAARRGLDAIRARRVP